MDNEIPISEDRLRAMLANIRAAAANTRQSMDFTGDEDWVQDGESDAEFLHAIHRETITKLDSTAQDIEALLAQGPDSRQP